LNGPGSSLRAALTKAVAEELITRNVAAVVRLPAPRKPQRQSWSADEARKFLESARSDNDPLYAAYVLILVLGLRRGELLGLTWSDVNFGTMEVHIRWQLQRAEHQLRHRETKTASSTAVLPLPDICITALKLPSERQEADRDRAGDPGSTANSWSTVATARRTDRGTSTGNSPADAARPR